MTAADFKAGLIALFGDAWRTRAPIEFDTTISSLDRWANGHQPVPGPAGRLMERLMDREGERRTQRSYERAYKTKKRKEPAHGQP